MDLVIKNTHILLIHNSQIKATIHNSQSQSHSSSNNGFPIIAIAIIGILATAFLLLGYYIFAIKCCLNWHRIDLLRRRFSLSPDHPFLPHSPAPQTSRGLDESVIRSIPIFHFTNNRIESECSVCLSEFRQEEKLRMIPNCTHVFHIDCIDIWLQNNANCPLCRTSISSTPLHFPLNRFPEPQPITDQDFVVIELGETNEQQRLNSGEPSVRSIGSSPRKTEPKSGRKKPKKSMGDECIDIRGRDDEFAKIQPIRRSFSMDSAADRQFYLAVQEVLSGERSRCVAEVSSGEGCSARIRRSLFSFGRRNAVLPTHSET